MAEDLKAVAARVFSVWNGEESGYEAIAEDCVYHDSTSPEPLRGRSAIRERVHSYRQAAPEMKLVSEESIVVGDLVVGVWSATGVGDKPLRGASVGRFRDAKIVESWVFNASEG